MTPVRWRVHAAWLLVAVLAAVGSWWATGELLGPPEVSGAEPAEVVTYQAEFGEVFEVTSVMADVEFQPGPSGVAGAAGTLTSVGVDPEQPISEGDVLVTVDLRPVIAAQGDVPAFRDLREGVSGPDVAQLRAFLDLPDGEEFDRTVAAAVVEWQESLGIEPDGIVRRGDVVFLAQLPTRAYLSDGVSLGAEVGPGQQLVSTTRDRPVVTILEGASGQLREGMVAQIQAPSQDPIEAWLGQTRTTADGNAEFPVVDAAGDPACTTGCALAFEVPGAAQVPVSIELISPATGVVVPDSAVATQPDGSTVVLTAEGNPVPVQVVTSAGGMSLVDGLDAGTDVRLFGEQVQP